jgi:predicted DNA-binding protein
MAQYDKPLRFRLAAELEQRIRATARRRGQSVSELLRQIIADGVRKLEEQR